MNLPDIFNPANQSIKEFQSKELLKTNKKSQKYGLLLTADDALEVIEERNKALRSCGRVELDTEVTSKIISHLCTSPYINQEDYCSTIIELQEIFYYLKTETDDSISDNELIQTIMELFNETCAGSVELLAGREVDKLIRNFREGKL